MKTKTIKKNMDVITMSKVIAMTALKTAYRNATSDAQLQVFYPSVYNDTFDEFQSIATLAILETMNKLKLNYDANITQKRFEKIAPNAYKAINKYIYSMRKDTNKALYSIDVDERGNTIASNETIRLQRSKFELAYTLKSNMRPAQWKVLTYLTLGYSYETIQKRMGYKTMHSTQVLCQQARQTAKEILYHEYGIDKAQSERTKSRKRKANGKGKVTK